MLLPLFIIIVGALIVVGDTWWAKKRILVYCRGARLDVLSLRPSLGYRGPFSPFRGKHIFRGVLKEHDGSAEFPAWFSSAGLMSVTPDEPLEVKFSR
jgi:hypothetical protein